MGHRHRGNGVVVLGIALVLEAIVGMGSHVPEAWGQVELFVVNFGSNAIAVYDKTADGEATPLRTIAGPATLLSGPAWLVVDQAHDELVVANYNNASITVYARMASGDTAPLRTLAGPATLLGKPQGLVVDPTHDELLVANSTHNSITVYARTATGNTAPVRTLAGPGSLLNGPAGLFLDQVHDELLVANYGNDSITVYARTASGNTAPLRTLAGPAPGLSQPLGIVLDQTNDELLVANYGNNSITVYARTASGDTAPLRTLAGPATLLSGPAGLILDAVRNELVVPNFKPPMESVTVYLRTVNGDTAPLRTLIGSRGVSGLSQPISVVVTTGATSAIGSIIMKRRMAVNRVALGLALNLLGSILVLITTQYGMAAGHGQSVTGASPRWRYVHGLGWGLMILGFFLQMVDSWYKSRV